MVHSRRGPRTASELMAELEADPEYRRRRAEREAEEERELISLAKAEKPLLDDLAAVDVHTDSAWNLYRHPESLPKAIPLLLEHLERDYPDKVLEGIGNALNDKAARTWWQEIADLYVSTSNAVVRDRLATVLAGIAVRAHYDDLLSFLARESLGATRIYFLRPVHRIGNRMESGEGRRVIEGLTDDQVLATEARRILAGRSRSE